MYNMRLATRPLCSSQFKVFACFVISFLALPRLAAKPAPLITQNVVPDGHSGSESAGIAWRVIGGWHEQGFDHALRAGEAIAPGALLLPGGGKNQSHSIIVLLPDGQRILYECFTDRQCARGFRVPDLYREPENFAVSFLAKVRASLYRINGVSPIILPDGSELPRDEAVVSYRQDHAVKVGGLVSSLPNGNYTCELRTIVPGHTAVLRREFSKIGSDIALSIPAPGLYFTTILDNLQRPRIDLFLVVARPALAPQITANLKRAHQLLLDWNENYQGWPIHEFQRAYLASLMLGLATPTAAPTKSLIKSTQHPDVTDEPTFSPKPGLFNGDTKVELHCGTPGAVIHFTVDSSQPVESSLVYRAPVVVKGTELTIKAFASAPGKKDSPVVTGIFRIRE